MKIDLQKLNPDFRNAIDLFFFSNRIDIDLSAFKGIIASSDLHLFYLLNSFSKSIEVFWIDAENIWYNKFQALYNLNNKTISKYISSTIEKNMFALLKNKQNINLNYDNEYIQFIQLCKIKQQRKHDLTNIKQQLTDLPNYIKIDKTIEIINNFIPYVFKDIKEFIDIIINRITYSIKNLDLLKQLDFYGITYDKSMLVSLSKSLLLDRTIYYKNIDVIFALLNEDFILQEIKKQYSNSYKNRIIEIFREADYQQIDDKHLTNIKNIIKLDPELINDIQIIYADKLYARNTGHIKSNADKLIRLLKNIPESNAKKMLSYLSTKHKLSDIKYMMESFPELQKLSVFV